MKFLISESQYKWLLNEQPYLRSAPPMPSDRLGPQGSFQSVENKNTSRDQYYKLVNSIPPNKIKQIRLIFPQQGWEEVALRWLQKFGVVTGFYTNLNQALKFIDNLKTKQVKANELVVGSHGYEGTLLMTKEGQDFYFDNSFLNDIKGIISPSSKVFFTACHGADYLGSLKDAAERLGVGVYGASGVYNYISNSAEKGFYFCSPNKYQKPIDYTINPYVIESNDSIKITNPSKEKWGDDHQDIRFQISKNLIGNDITTVPDKQMLDDIITHGYSYNTPKLVEFSVEHWSLYTAIKNTIDLQTIKNTPIYKQYFEPINENNDQKARKMFIDWFNNGDIKILVKKIDSDSYQDVKTIKKYVIYKYIDNDFLLKNKLCQKVPSSPISWV